MLNDDFEQKVENSKNILEQLSKPDITLHESMKLYQDGIKAIEEAQKILQDAKLEFETINSKE
jgi:exodeoxyribonuclease VII small subunit